MQTIGEDTRSVFKFVTPSGVTGLVATDIPREALEALHAKLLRRVQRDECAHRLACRRLPHHR